MFTINARYKRSQKDVGDWFIIIVNGINCACNKSIAEEISPVIQSYNNDEKNKNIIFKTEIPECQALPFVSINSENSLFSICNIISHIFRGDEIECQENNIDILRVIGKHFRIQEIADITEDYLKYLEMIPSSLKDSIDFKEMIKLEKMLLYEINETNIEIKVKEYESMIKTIPENCIIHFVVNICIKNYQNKRVDNNEYIIEIIKNIDKICPNTFSHFISFMFNTFVIINSNLNYEISEINKKELNSLIQHMFADGLMRGMCENIKFNRNGIVIPADLTKYFKKTEKYFMLSLSLEDEHQSLNGEIKDQYIPFLESIQYDNIDLFQDWITRSQINIDKLLTNDFPIRIYFLDVHEKISLIELSAFLGSIKCFKYLFNKQTKINKNSLSNFAVAGGNTEIIHICEREGCFFNERALDLSIEYHNHKITKWLVETKRIEVKERNLRHCIMNCNIQTLKYLIKKGININKMIIYLSGSNNTFLYKWLKSLPKNNEMKMIYQENIKESFRIACEQSDFEIVKLLITEDNIDINSKYEAIL